MTTIRRLPPSAFLFNFKVLQMMHSQFYFYAILQYEGGSINYVTNELYIKTTSAICRNDTSQKRANSCGYSDILHNDNHIFLRPANQTTMSISYRHWSYLRLKLIKFLYGWTQKKNDNFFDSWYISLKLYSTFKLTIFNIKHSLQ